MHANIVILGLNPSKDIAFGSNFHGNRFDRWYEKCFSAPPFTGAFMTDLMAYSEPNSAVVLKKWKQARFRDKYVRALRQQFSTLGIKPSTPIVCIGQSTKKLFTAAFPNFLNVLCLKHPNSYRMKGKEKIFSHDVELLRERVEEVLASR